MGQICLDLLFVSGHSIGLQASGFRSGLLFTTLESRSKRKRRKYEMGNPLMGTTSLLTLRSDLNYDLIRFLNGCNLLLSL